MRAGGQNTHLAARAPFVCRAEFRHRRGVRTASLFPLRFCLFDTEQEAWRPPEFAAVLAGQTLQKEDVK